MALFVSKLSLEKAGNPEGIPIYGPCEYNDKDVEVIEDDGEDEITDDEKVEYEEDLKPLTMEILLEEFQDRRLRQGWGYEYNIYSLDLQDGSKRDKNGRIQPTKEWVCAFKRIYETSQKKAIGRFQIISKLLDMEDDDIVFVPNIPSDDMFSVATVNGGYEFAQIEGYYGHGHIIHVKDVEEYYYGDDTIPKKLWSFPPAVVRIRKDEKFNKFLEKSYFKR